ncbi:MAG: hypothetical protein HRT93_11150 [Piscirickettsiaceae bacterium]|nr:hypothetical protein [Piscirickettsiaceae bacterium]
MPNQQKSVSVTENEIAYVGIYKISYDIITVSYGEYHKSTQLGTFGKQQTNSIARILLRELINEKIGRE